MNDVLDNPVWHALTGPQSPFARRGGHAARFAPDVAPFFAIDGAGDEAYRDLARILGHAPEARLFRPRSEPVPSGWRKTFEKPILQMVLPGDTGLPSECPQLVRLEDADAADTMALVERTRPGPFGARTMALGTYLAIRRDGALVAMAGERLRLPGLVEISAVAVDPAHRGRGFARTLTAALAAQIRASGNVPFLHVFPDNDAAAGLYRSMGFATRAELIVVWLAHDGGREG